MTTKTNCQLAVHLGLSTVSFVRVKREDNQWRVVGSGYVPLTNTDATSEGYADQLKSVLQSIARDEGLSRESVHVGLHSRYCVTRSATGNLAQVEGQIAEVYQNSCHYLQLGLGEKLHGQSIVELSGSRWYGQVAIITRGLIESIEDAFAGASLELCSLDGALSSVCRLAGYCGLDDDPLLIVWHGTGGAEIGISYQGRLQLSYNACASQTIEQTSATIGKHLKRLRRFCNRYRHVDGCTELSRVLVLAGPQQSVGLREELEPLGFECIYTLEDLKVTKLSENLQGHAIDSPGAISALGGLLAHLDRRSHPLTDVFNNYHALKPRTLWSIVLQEGLAPLAAATILLVMLGAGWCLRSREAALQEECLELSIGFDENREQILVLDSLQGQLSEIRRLEQSVVQQPVDELIAQIASCLPADTRIEWVGVDASDSLLLKGISLRGDRTYELLRALRSLPAVAEVSLESVGRATNFGESATMFEIHCALHAQSSKSTTARHVASHDTRSASS